MFRRLSNTLPPDFDFPTTLHELGYFINGNDQIRMIEKPEQPFHYWISKNERYVQRHREAFHVCIRDLLYQRLSNLDLELTRLPLGTPVDTPHVPIWVSKNISSCKRLIVYVGESHQDLGVFAGRIITKDSINAGSAVSFVNAVQSSFCGPLPVEKQPGIVIANPGQLLWHRHGKKALTWESWYALKRSSAVGPPYEVTEKNKIPGNGSTIEHIASVFKDVVLPQGDHAEIFVIAVGDMAHDVFDYLQADWLSCVGKVKGFTILASNFVWQNTFHDEAFMEWFGERARAYLVSGEPVSTPLQGRSRFGCNVYSGGEPLHVECLMRSAHPTVLDYFKLISQIPDYVNPPQDFDQDPSIEPETGEGPGWDDAETQCDTDGKAAASTGETEAIEEVPGTETRKISSSREPASILTERLAGLDLNTTPGPSTERFEGRAPSTPILAPVEQHAPTFPPPQSPSPNRSPTGESEYSAATSQVRSTGYVTPPERVLPFVEERIEPLSETTVGSIAIHPLNGLRVLNPNTSVRGRSFSGASGASTSGDASTASPPPPPAVPNSTPEMGSTPEPEYRIGRGRNGSSLDEWPGSGMGTAHGSLIREVLRFDEHTHRVNFGGLNDAGEGTGQDENEVGGGPLNGHTAEGNGKADG